MEKHTDNGFLGTYSVDTMKKIPIISSENNSGNFLFVVNTLPILKGGKVNTEVGHWVAVNVIRDPPTVEYYNPFGYPPAKGMLTQIKKLLRRMSQPKSQFKINQIQDQANNSMNCGWHSMKFLTDRYSGKRFRTASGFDAVNGEANVKDYKKYYQKFGMIK